LVAFSILVLLVPVSLQIFSRYTRLVPTYIWTEEMARFLFIWTIMIGAMIGVRESAHFDCDVWPQVSRLGCPWSAVRPHWRTPYRFGVHLGGRRVHEVRLEPQLGARRPTALADPHRLAPGRRFLDHLPLGEQMFDDIKIVAGRMS